MKSGKVWKEKRGILIDQRRTYLNIWFQSGIHSLQIRELHIFKRKKGTEII